MSELPDYADLPPAPYGGRSACGLFGTEDNLGLVNLMTPQQIAAAARLVRRGQVFCLDMPLGSISPALAMFRGAPRHQVVHQPGTAGFDDVDDNLAGTGSPRSSAARSCSANGMSSPGRSALMKNPAPAACSPEPKVPAGPGPGGHAVGRSP